MGCLVINQVNGIGNKTYLELGVGNGRNFEKVRCARKMSVDINGKGVFLGTTNEFFQQQASRVSWDFIYIDANHNLPFVLDDFNNATEHCDEWVLIHDMIPPSEKYTVQRLCSDSYKLLFYFLRHSEYQVYPMNENFGLTFVRMPAKKVVLTSDDRAVLYQDFVKLIAETHLYSQEEIVRILNHG